MPALLEPVVSSVSVAPVLLPQHITENALRVVYEIDSVEHGFVVFLAQKKEKLIICVFCNGKIMEHDAPQGSQSFVILLVSDKRLHLRFLGDPKDFPRDGFIDYRIVAAP